MALLISFLKILFLKSIAYENCMTDDAADCRFTDFQIAGTIGGTLGRCGSDPKNLYLGPFGQRTTLTKTFTNIPPNKELEMSFNVWKLDSWDAEGFEIYVNNELLENLVIQFGKGAMICRNELYEDSLEPLSFKFSIIGSDLIIKIKDNLDQDLSDESWGIRDFVLRLKVPCVNFYSECNYTGTLLQICQGEQSKLQNYIPFEIKSIWMGSGIIVQLKGPNFFDGVLQEFTSSQSCLDGFQFPKVIYQE
ncbi:unnamed protein product [Paramecium octaurelia]|uniref:Galectin n=1 Tax=Paramecium octaurelia TaxID=43137 RepID=A0A8S1YLQ3_PAROT|nr:unnamed protein product [Paramecium octaurelia]